MDEAAQVAKKGSDDVARSADDAAAAGKGDEAASKADDADESAKDDGKSLSDKLDDAARRKARREAREDLKESFRETPTPTSRYDPYETSIEDEFTVDAGSFVYWELPFGTWGASAGRSDDSVSIRYTADTIGLGKPVDVFLFEEHWFGEYTQRRESRYITAGSDSVGGLSASVDTSVPAEDYVLVVDNTVVGEASGTMSVDVLLRFSSSSAF